MKQKYYYGPGEYYLYFTSSTSLMNSIGTVGGQAIIREDSLGGDSRRFVFTNPVTYINDYEFEDCTGLYSIQLPARIQSIGDFAFSGCIHLDSVDIPSGCTSIGDNAFENCSLDTITIPSGCITIGDSAFKGCLPTSIVLGENITNIGSLAFLMEYDVFGENDYRITSLSTTPPSIQANTFIFNLHTNQGSGSLFVLQGNEIVLYVPSLSAYNAYLSNQNWSNLFFTPNYTNVVVQS